MKLVKLFIDRPAGLEANHEPFALVPPSQATNASSSIVFEWPIKSEEVPFVTRSMLPGGELYWNMGLWILTDKIVAQLNSGSYFVGNDKPTLAMQKLVRFATEIWTPYAKVFKRTEVPFEQMLSVWRDSPDVFHKYIARHKAPSLFTRQNYFTVLRWIAWNNAGRTMQERVDEMEAKGCGGGNLRADNLSARARRLGLA